MELKDKVALITGGGQGIGRTVAEELARLGAHTVLAGCDLLLTPDSFSRVILDS